jgi:hypothetical protein
MGCSTKSIGDVELAMAEIGCSTKSIGVVGVAVAEMAYSRKIIEDVGVAVVADAHGKTMQAEGDNDILQSSGKICCNFYI